MANQLMASHNQRNNSTSGSGSVLDAMMERIVNIDRSIVNRDIHVTLSEAIEASASKERTLRHSTITILMTETIDHDAIVKAIEERWTRDTKQLPATYWQDAKQTFCQFATIEAKEAFLKFSANDPRYLINELLLRPNRDGTHYQRKPVKLEITNVRASIDAKQLSESLQSLALTEGDISELREGKPHAATKARSLMLTTNSNGFRRIFENLEGAIPYVNLSNGTKARLAIRINCRPWLCKECFRIGKHQCDGKLCAQCGSKDHITRDCKSNTRNCSNCKKHGHRARDIECPTYVRELIKEIRKCDIPLEYYETQERRLVLIKALLLK